MPNAFYKTLDFDFLQAMPREELHQFLIGVYGNNIIPSTLYEVEQVLRDCVNLALSSVSLAQTRCATWSAMRCWVECGLGYGIGCVLWTLDPPWWRLLRIMQPIFMICI